MTSAHVMPLNADYTKFSRMQDVFHVVLKLHTDGIRWDGEPDWDGMPPKRRLPDISARLAFELCIFRNSTSKRTAIH